MKFSLRGLLLAVTCLAFFLGGWMSHIEFLKYEKRQRINGVAARIPTTKVPYMTVPATSLLQRLEGVVVGMDAESNTIAISLGADDGLRPGNTIYVYRGLELIAEGNVFFVQSNKSAVKIPSGITIEISDYVTTLKGR